MSCQDHMCNICYTEIQNRSIDIDSEMPEKSFYLALIYHPDLSQHRFTRQ